MLRSFQIFALIFCLTSCITNKSTALPEWYLNPPQNNSISLYGVGYGKDVKNAEQDALNNLAQKIVVSVSSQMDISKQENTYNKTSNFSESARQEISSKVQKISFQNFKNEKSSVFNKDIYTLVSVNRDELAKNYITKIENYNRQIDNLVKNSKDKTLIEQKAAFVQIEDIVTKSAQELIILKAVSLDNSLTSSFDQKYNQLALAHQTIDNNLSVYFEYDDKSSKIAKMLENQLTKQNIKVNKNRTNTANEVIFKITAETNNQNLHSTYYQKNEINIAILSNKNQVIKTKQLSASGASSISYIEAENNMIKQLAKKLESEDIFKTMGF